MVNPFALDGRLRNAELVNPVADCLKSLLNRFILTILSIFFPYPQRHGNKATLVKRRALLIGRIFVFDQFQDGIGSSLFIDHDGNLVGTASGNPFEAKVFTVQSIFEIRSYKVK